MPLTVLGTLSPPLSLPLTPLCSLFSCVSERLSHLPVVTQPGSCGALTCTEASLAPNPGSSGVLRQEQPYKLRDNFGKREYYVFKAKGS